MRVAKVVVVLALSLVCRLSASGGAGVYAVVEKVVFEPNEAAATRVQVWGAFSFVQQSEYNFSGAPAPGRTVSDGPTTKPERGYLYFSMPPDSTEAQVKLTRTEWADLKAVAGTRDAVAFGRWMFIGAFNENGGNRIFVTVPDGPRGYRGVPLAVFTSTLPSAAEPVPYVTDTGIVKLPATGNHAAIVAKLREALAR